jgi:hypothetical protein
VILNHRSLNRLKDLSDRAAEDVQRVRVQSIVAMSDNPDAKNEWWVWRRRTHWGILGQNMFFCMFVYDASAPKWMLLPPSI